MADVGTCEMGATFWSRTSGLWNCVMQEILKNHLGLSNCITEYHRGGKMALGFVPMNNESFKTGITNYNSQVQ